MSVVDKIYLKWIGSVGRTFGRTQKFPQNVLSKISKISSKFTF